MIALENVTHLFGANAPQGLRAARQRAGKVRIREQLDATLALDDVSLEIARGQLFVVMGLSGSGKSTLIRLVNGLIRPQAGTVRVDGADVTSMARRDLTAFRRNRISMVFQSFALFPHKTVGENAAFGLAVEGVSRAERDARAVRWLRRVGLEGYENAYPDALSGGMRQRVGLARALTVEAPVMLMDEPFSALDPITRSDLQHLLKQLHGELDRTIVFVTHDFAEATALADRVAVLDEGRIAQVDTVEGLVGAPAGAHVARFVASAAKTAGPGSETD